MAKSKFKLVFTDEYYDTLNEALDYIVLEIINPLAALALINETKKAIDKRLPIADSFSSIPYKTKKKEYNVYHIKVNNFYIFYTITEDNTMEVLRFANGRIKLSNIVKKEIDQIIDSITGIIKDEGKSLKAYREERLSEYENID